jgi:hypothetical protein
MQQLSAHCLLPLLRLFEPFSLKVLLQYKLSTKFNHHIHMHMYRIAALCATCCCCRYVHALFALAHDDSALVRQEVCKGLVQLLTVQPDKLQPHLYQVRP